MSVDTAHIKDGQLEITVSRDRALVTLALRGELDLSNVDTTESVLREAEADDGVARIVLDIQGLTFIDSTGLAWLLGAARRLNSDSKRLRLTGTTPAVRRILELTGVSEHLAELG